MHRGAVNLAEPGKAPRFRTFAHPRVRGRGRLADARECRDRAGVVPTGAIADAGALADRTGTGTVAGEVTDARSFCHGASAKTAGRLAMAVVLGDGACIPNTREVLKANPLHTWAEFSKQAFSPWQAPADTLPVLDWH